MTTKGKREKRHSTGIKAARTIDLELVQSDEGTRRGSSCSTSNEKDKTTEPIVDKKAHRHWRLTKVSDSSLSKEKTLDNYFHR